MPIKKTSCDANGLYTITETLYHGLAESEVEWLREQEADEAGSTPEEAPAPAKKAALKKTPKKAAPKKAATKKATKKAAKKVAKKPIKKAAPQEGRRQEKPMSRKLKAEWWELWWDRPGSKPVFVPMYGQPTPFWIPDGCYPSREEALHEKKRRNNKFDRLIHVRRYLKVKP